MLVRSVGDGRSIGPGAIRHTKRTTRMKSKTHGEVGDQFFLSKIWRPAVPMVFGPIQQRWIMRTSILQVRHPDMSLLEMKISVAVLPALSPAGLDVLDPIWYTTEFGLSNSSQPDLTLHPCTISPQPSLPSCSS